MVTIQELIAENEQLRQIIETADRNRLDTVKKVEAEIALIRSYCTCECHLCELSRGIANRLEAALIH